MAEKLADLVWKLVSGWDALAKATVGRQLVRAADSIGANIAEGYGRGTPTDNRRFVRIARGSLYESKHWLRRAFRRDLMTESDVAMIHPVIEELAPRLNAYMNSIGRARVSKSGQFPKPNNNPQPTTDYRLI